MEEKPKQTGTQYSPEVYSDHLWKGLVGWTCPMDINIPEYLKDGDRVLSTECILCQTCISICPDKNLTMTGKWNLGEKKSFDEKGKGRKNQSTTLIKCLPPNLVLSNINRQIDRTTGLIHS